MANYEYKCPTCQAVKTVSHSIHDSHSELCENCKVPLIKQFGAPLISFKGGGWGHQA